MLLAAGLGTRMRPITDHTPKPLVEVGGKALIDWTIDPLANAGVNRVVVNIHHLADKMRRHLEQRQTPPVIISDETAALLDTGGGIVKALPLLGDAPFFVCNCDGILIDAPGKPGAFQKLIAAWNPAQLDVLMLVHPMQKAHGFDGAGDFFVSDTGNMIRRGKSARAPFVYAGAWIVHPRVFANEPPVAFSANKIWDRAIAANRMKAVVHDGDWYHVGTPDAVSETALLLETAA
jgi:MurNAc alpha-1-phosphate uridylyltransferase